MSSPDTLPTEQQQQLTSFTTHYQAIKKIGYGAQGSIYLLKSRKEKQEEEETEFNNNNNNTAVAKVFPHHTEGSPSKQALNELHAMQFIPPHPLVIRYLEHFLEPDRLVIVMEFAACGDLAGQILSRRKNKAPFKEREILILFAQLCLSVAHLHRRRTVHRDIKPHNLFLTNRGLLKLGDFGLSRLLSEQCKSLKDVAGTTQYAAPEMWNHAENDGKADIWSMGVSLYEMLALRRPFPEGMDPTMLKNLVCNAEIYPLHECLPLCNPISPPVVTTSATSATTSPNHPDSLQTYTDEDQKQQDKEQKEKMLSQTYPPSRSPTTSSTHNSTSSSPLYSQELHQLVKVLLTVDPKARPDIEEILQMPIVKKGVATFREAVGTFSGKIKSELKTVFDENEGTF